VRHKRAKKAAEYDLKEALESLLGRPSSGDPEPWAAEPPPSRVMTTVVLEDPPPHLWLCDGRLLVLEENQHKNNMKLFQEQWRRGQPVIVANVSNNLDINLWSPKAFNEQFGMLKHNIVNCKTHKMIPKVPLKWFWDGFESLTSRMLDKQGMPMLLKLKDWPPEDDFAQYFPRRFENLMQWLPMGDYTKREGRYNLASYIPEFCVRPDLGPKMYIAYGSPLYPECGSTNLHMDMSDAVNLIVYVGVPTDSNKHDLFEEGLRAVDEAGCDLATKKRVRKKGVVVGALWHIYHPRDADKIRDFLNKVSIEKGHKLEPHNDPIHDQSVYLDGHLRGRLFKEYGVVGYPIPQCEGDTIFIPAGAPHQVRNIHNCIKVAEDFVSPEGLEWCFNITEDFRHLTDNHTNHEDKLQIKNILYHAVKNCVAVLENYELKNEGRTC
jgi:lysine-specific demethylase 3